MIEVSYMFCILFLRLLKEAADDDHYRKRFHLMFGGLLSIVGEKMRSELSKQEDFVRVLSSIADKVKTGRDKEVCNNFILSNWRTTVVLLNVSVVIALNYSLVCYVVVVVDNAVVLISICSSSSYDIN